MRTRLGSADAMLLVTVLIWSLNFTVMKYALSHGFEPLAYAAMRFGVGSLVFAGITLAREGSVRVGRREAVLLLGAIGVCLYLNQIAFASALRLTTASTVALLFGTLPVFVGILGLALRVERARARHWTAAAVSFAGVALVAAGAGGGLSGDLGGILVGLVAPLTWAFYSVAVTPLMHRYSLYRISAVAGLGAIVPLLVTAGPQLVAEDWSEISTLAWTALAYSTVASFVLTNVLWFRAIHRIGANRASLYANLQPFVGALFAVILLSESLGPLQIAGGVVIGAGILLARPRQPPVEIVD
ncbi:MAG: DMT family transporter [Gaiellales bacterium]